jgi:hypothetical protein
MLSNFSPYSAQGLMPQFPGLQAGGSPQINPGLFGQPGFAQLGFAQPGANGGNSGFGQESAQTGLGQPYPFGAQASFLQPLPLQQGPLQQGSLQQGPFAQNQSWQSPLFWQSPLSTNPYLQSPPPQYSQVHHPLLNSLAGPAGMHNQSQHMVTLLGQLAQQLSAHSAVTQQSAIALHQLVQLLVLQNQSGHSGGSPGAGQAFGFGAPFAGGPAGGSGQYFGQNPFTNAQGAYGGFAPQAQAWGANRSQTIQ